MAQGNYKSQYHHQLVLQRRECMLQIASFSEQ
jgi:hypothetical protein